MPDLLVSGSGWSLFLECKNSGSRDGLCVKVAALEAYRAIQALSGSRVYLATTTQGWTGITERGLTTRDNRNAASYKLHGQLVVATLSAIEAQKLKVRTSAADHHQSVPEFGLYERRSTEPYVVVPRTLFTWPLQDLLKQMEAGKKRPRPPAQEAGR